eukprot:EG_transcript_23581
MVRVSHVHLSHIYPYSPGCRLCGGERNQRNKFHRHTKLFRQPGVTGPRPSTSLPFLISFLLYSPFFHQLLVNVLWRVGSRTPVSLACDCDQVSTGVLAKAFKVQKSLGRRVVLSKTSQRR